MKVAYGGAVRSFLSSPGISFDSEYALIARALQIETGNRILDLACGPGIYTRRFAQHRPEAAVVGMDLSSPMLRYALRRTLEEQLTNVTLVRGDALAFPFGTGASMPSTAAAHGTCFPTSMRSCARSAAYCATAAASRSLRSGVATARSPGPEQISAGGSTASIPLLPPGSCSASTLPGSQTPVAFTPPESGSSSPPRRTPTAHREALNGTDQRRSPEIDIFNSPFSEGRAYVVVGAAAASCGTFRQATT